MDTLTHFNDLSSPSSHHTRHPSHPSPSSPSGCSLAFLGIGTVPWYSYSVANMISGPNPADIFLQSTSSFRQCTFKLATFTNVRNTTVLQGPPDRKQQFLLSLSPFSSKEGSISARPGRQPLISKTPRSNQTPSIEPTTPASAFHAQFPS